MSRSDTADVPTKEVFIHSINYDAEKDIKAGGNALTVPKRKSLIVGDFSKSKPTFFRLKRKLDNIKKYYPELYFRDESIIEIFANADPDNFLKSTLVEYDEDTSDFIWI